MSVLLYNNTAPNYTNPSQKGCPISSAIEPSRKESGSGRGIQVVISVYVGWGGGSSRRGQSNAIPTCVESRLPDGVLLFRKATQLGLARIILITDMTRS